MWIINKNLDDWSFIFLSFNRIIIESCLKERKNPRASRQRPSTSIWWEQEPFHRECFYVTGTWFTDDGFVSSKNLDHHLNERNSSKKNQETIINGIPEGYHRDLFRKLLKKEWNKEKIMKEREKEMEED